MGDPRTIVSMSPHGHSSANNKNAEEDPWALPEDDDDYEKWSDMNAKRRCRSVAIHITKIVLVLACLYLFICSLSIMGSSFQVLAGKTAGTIFQNNVILSNPVAGLIIGILVTVLVQSSSTSTSIVTTMVGANIITVHDAIPIVMGANIGTSVTNTIVSLSQSMDVTQFRRAFAGATVHDIFNLLSVLILLPIEVASGMLWRLTKAIVDSIFVGEVEKPPKILKVITDPLTKKIIQVNKKIIIEVAHLEENETLPENATMLQTTCKDYVNGSTVKVPCNSGHYIFAGANKTMGDGGAGAILLIVSLVALCVCLVLMVKLLHSMMKGNIARTIKKVINANIRYPFKWLAGYLAILVGAGLTFVVQSSSVFTSTMTPLVGIGVISIDRMYPLTLGSNIGTTTTSLLAALASDPESLKQTLQIALCHLFFNIFGISIWYPIPFMRKIPIKGAKALGNTTAKYRWFAVFYLLMVFFLIPAALLGLSIAHIWAMGAVLIVAGVVVATVTVLNVLQSYIPNRLPPKLRTWEFLPIWMHSLKPYNRVFTLLCGSCGCCKRVCSSSHGATKSEVHENGAFDMTENDTKV